jgi:hypothetical protein
MIRTLTLTLLMISLLAGSVHPTFAVAQTADISCDDFVTQPAAQALLDADAAYAAALDEDGNGVACEDLPSTRSGDSVSVPQASPTSAPEEAATPEAVVTTDASPSAPALSDEEVAAALDGRYGGSRESFEALYGAPRETDEAEEAASFFYDIPGFESVEVAYYEGFVRAFVVALPGPVDVATGNNLVDFFLPVDTTIEAQNVDNGAGALVTIAFSPALQQRFDAEVYELYGATGQQGEFYYQFRLDDDGQVAAIDMTLGGRLDETEPAGDTAAYLAEAMAGYDGVIASMGVFAALIGAPPDEPTDAYRDALRTEAAIWQDAYTAALALTPPDELADLHEQYLAFMDLMNDAAADINNGLDQDDPDLIDQGINQVIEATTLIEDLDGAFAAAAL